MTRDPELAELEAQIERHRANQRRLLAELDAELLEIFAMVELLALLESIPPGPMN